MPYLILHSTVGSPDVEEDDNWQKEWGLKSKVFYGPVVRGEAPDAKYNPESGYLGKPISSIPNFFYSGALYCNEEMKEILINEFDGKLHNFIPIKLRKSKKGDFLETIYFINILAPLDCIDVEKSTEVKFGKRYDGLAKNIDCLGLKPAEKKGIKSIILRQSAIEGRHLWYDTMTRSLREVFISDALYDRLQQLKCGGIRYFKAYAE